jgi:histidinol-phosphate aminotransferase
MFDPDLLVRENVRNLIPYSSARDDFKGKEGIFMDANENPYGSLNRYPDPYQKDLKTEVSRIKKIPVENIFFGNGSDEIIDLCFRIFCKPGIDRALTFSPTYGMYEVSAAVNDIRMIKIPLDKKFRIDFNALEPFLQDSRLRLIFICTPNNPTGNTMQPDIVERIISEFKGIVIVDEAYNDFSNHPSLIHKLDGYPNLIVMQTFSKAFGLAAARVGMAFASPSLLKYFNKMKPPYNISTINQKAAIKKLMNPNTSANQIRKIKAERERLFSELKKLSFTEEVFPSDSNFILIRVKDAGSIYNYLVEKGIIVRNRSTVVDNCLRITIGKKSENDKLLESLKTIKI